LTSITLPDSVTSIGRNAFYRCRKLRSISVDVNHPAYRDDDGILFNKTSNILIVYPVGKSGTKYTIPDGVTTIADYAFSGSNLTSITLPDSVTNIGNGAFSNCESLASITLPDSVTIIGESTFLFCENLASIILPDGITTIATGAFEFCLCLTSITIPDSVTYIGDNAFDNRGSMVIHCSVGSYAEKYAKENGIKCNSEPVNRDN
jgi:hypothetical protein